jgi:hypothetical protein
MTNWSRPPRPEERLGSVIVEGQTARKDQR